MARDPNVPDLFDVYTVVILRRPSPSPDFTEAELADLQRQHLAYRAELGRQGVLVVNGPLMEQSDETLRGFSIFACSLAEARRLTEADPSVRAGRLTYDVMEWWTRSDALAFPQADRQVGERRSLD
jgi:uncharacterized protein YciI